MNILVASDKFKGSLTAAEACEAIRAGLASGFESRNEVPQIRTLPVADGGGRHRTNSDRCTIWKMENMHRS